MSDVAMPGPPETPAVDRKGKRRKLLTGSESPSTLSGLQTLQRSPVANHRMPRAVLHRKEALTASMPAGSPPVSLCSQTSTQVREPLVEMTSVSPQLNRRAAVPRVPVFEVPSSSNSNAHNKATKVQSKAMIAKAKTTAVHPAGTTFLPTPPTSSGESAVGEIRRSSAPKSARRALQKAAAKTDCLSVLFAQSSTADTLRQSTVLLGRSLRTEERCENDTRDLNQLLQRSELSFTYSTPCFIRHIYQDATNLHFVLVDAQQPKAVAHDIFELGLDMIRSPNIGTIEHSTAVLFVDFFTFLNGPASRFGDWGDVKILEHCVCACLELGPDIVDKIGDRAARVVWDWHESRIVSPCSDLPN